MILRLHHNWFVKIFNFHSLLPRMQAHEFIPYISPLVLNLTCYSIRILYIATNETIDKKYRRRIFYALRLEENDGFKQRELYLFGSSQGSAKSHRMRPNDGNQNGVYIACSYVVVRAELFRF